MLLVLMVIMVILIFLFSVLDCCVLFFFLNDEVLFMFILLLLNRVSGLFVGGVRLIFLFCLVVVELDFVVCICLIRMMVKILLIWVVWVFDVSGE